MPSPGFRCRTVAIRVEGTLTGVRIPARFNGPPDSANGGYTCGLVAAELHGGGVEVTLRAPPPLETELTVEHADGTVTVSDGETLVAEARSAAIDVGELPAPVTPEEAEAAVQAGLQTLDVGNPFPTCFVCGPRRDHGDGLDIFPVQLEQGRFVATWTPEETGHGLGSPDCPTSAPVMNEGKDPPIVLARWPRRSTRSRRSGSATC